MSKSIRLLDFIWIWFGLQQLTTPWHHRKIGLWLELQWRFGVRRILLLAFRGAGKSTLIALFCAWKILQNPDIRILLLAADSDLAERMLYQIRSIIERHPLTTGLLPSKPGSWSGKSFRVNRNKFWRDDTVVAQGIWGNITGMRADLIIADDIETPRTAATRRWSQLLRHKLSELEYVITPGGGIVLLGTPHRRESIYFAQSQTSDFNIRDYARLTLPVLNKAGQSVWPEKFSAGRILAIRRSTSRLKFNSQMLLLPGEHQAGGLGANRICWYDSELDLQEAGQRSYLYLSGQRLIAGTCAWDPAFGKVHGCDSVVAAVFVDNNGYYYLHDVLYLPKVANDVGAANLAERQCSLVADFAARNYLPHIAVENNGIGMFLPGLLRQQLQQQGLPLGVSAITSTKAKSERIFAAYDPLLAAGRLLVNQRLRTSNWHHELCNWHSQQTTQIDGLDAVALCLGLQPVRLPRVRYRQVLRRPNWHGLTIKHAK